MFPLLLVILSQMTQTLSDEAPDRHMFVSDEAQGRQMFGLDTGNPAADQEAEMWIAALLGWS